MEIMVKKYDAILFDLDGTLLDSLEDMKDSVNHVMREFGFPEHTTEEIRTFVGNGIRRLIERSVPEDTDPRTCEAALKVYRSYYNDHCMIKTKPYDGVPELLAALKKEGFAMAIVSNKNEEAVEEMREHYFGDLVPLAFGQSDAVPKKPDPSMVYAAADRLGIPKERCIYVGDSEVDIETAKNAGIDCITCLWGFREKEFLLAEGARVLAEAAEDILRVVVEEKERE